MAIPATCPSCKAQSNAPDELGGKRVKCPKCKALMRIPLPDAEDGFDVVDSEPAERPAKRNRVRVEEDEEATAPRRSKRKPVVDEEDDEDDRPRKGRSKKARTVESAGVSPLRYAISGIVLVGLLVGIYFIYSWKFADPADGDPDSNPVAAGGDPQDRNPTPSATGGSLPAFHKINSFAIARDGRTFAASGSVSLGQGGGGTRVGSSNRTWDLTANDPLKGLEHRTKPAAMFDRIAISSDGRTIAAWTLRTVAFWKVGSAEPSSTVTVDMPGLNHSVPNEITLSDDGKTVRYINDGHLVVAEAGQPKATKIPLTGKPGDHAKIVAGRNQIAEVHSPSDRNVTELRTWDLTSGQPLATVPLGGLKSTFGPKYAISFDGKVLALSFDPRTTVKATIEFFNTADGQGTNQIVEAENDKLASFSDLTFSPDGKFVGCIGLGRDGSTLRTIDLYRINPGRGGDRIVRIPDEPAKFTGISKFGQLRFSPDSHWIAYVQDEKRIVKIGTATGKELP